jgi:hypothetical protein
LRNFYEDIFSDQSTIEDFELPPEIDSAKRVVDAFYGDAKSYYSGMSDKRVERGNFDFEIQGVEYLAKESGLQNFNSARRVDERGSAIEIQVGASVKLGDGILALICPEEYLTEKTVQHALQRWKKFLPTGCTPILP